MGLLKNTILSLKKTQITYILLSLTVPRVKMAPLTKKRWRNYLEHLSSYLQEILMVGNSTLKTTGAKAVNVVLGLHRILIAMLGGVPKAEHKEALRKLNEVKDIADKFLDEIENTVYVVKNKDQREIVRLKDLVDDFYLCLQRNANISEHFDGVTTEKIDAPAAEILYGVMRRHKK